MYICLVALAQNYVDYVDYAVPIINNGNDVSLSVQSSSITYTRWKRDSGLFGVVMRFEFRLFAKSLSSGCLGLLVSLLKLRIYARKESFTAMVNQWVDAALVSIPYILDSPRY